jgi:transposase
VWRPDPATAALRRQVLRRAHLVRQRTRLKNQVHAILHRNLIPRCSAADLFGHSGRRWLAEQDIPPDELAAARPMSSDIVSAAEFAIRSRRGTAFLHLTRYRCPADRLYRAKRILG